MKNRFKGWQDVFSFTLGQLMKGKAFLISTIIIAMVCFGVPILINVLIAKPEKKSDIKIDVVYLQDNSGLGDTIDYTEAIAENDMLSDAKLEMIEPKVNTDDLKTDNSEDKTDGKTPEELVKDSYKSGNSNIVIIIDKQEDTNYMINAYIAEESKVDKDAGEEVAGVFADYLKQVKLIASITTEEQLAEISLPVSTKINTLGEGEESFALMMIRTYVPMLAGLVLYFMVILYGQAIGKSMLTEKSSKILELMLTSTTSLALITGKIFAMIAGAILQLAIWVVSIFAGYFIGIEIARSINSEYHTEIGMVLDMLKENNAESAFSLPAIIIAILALVLGFVMFSVLAGAAGSFISRAEDMSSVMMWFQYAVVIGFIVPYFGAIQENKSLIIFSRYFPLCAPFSIPSEVLIGNVTIMQALLSLGILALLTVIFIIATGKIYRAMVLYNGDKPKFKDILDIIKN